MRGVTAVGTCPVCGGHDVDHAGTITSCADCGFDGAMDGALPDGSDEADKAWAVYDDRPARITPFFENRAVAEMVAGRLQAISGLDVYTRCSDRPGV